MNGVSVREEPGGGCGGCGGSCQWETEEELEAQQLYQANR